MIEESGVMKRMILEWADGRKSFTSHDLVKAFPQYRAHNLRNVLRRLVTAEKVHKMRPPEKLPDGTQYLYYRRSIA